MVEENILRLFTDVVLSLAPSPVDRLIAAKADGRAGSGFPLHVANPMQQREPCE